MQELIEQIKKDCFDNSCFENIMGALVNEATPDINKAELTFSNYYNKVVIGLSYKSTYKSIYLQYDKNSKDIYYSPTFARSLRDDNNIKLIIESVLKLLKNNYSFKINIKPAL